MREKIDDLIETGRAAVVRAAMVQGQSGQRMKSDAVTQMSFARQFTVPEVSDDGMLKAEPVVDSTVVRQLGVTVEIDALRIDSIGSVSMLVAPQFVSLLRKRNWGQGVAEIELPEFYSMDGITRVHLQDGISRLVSTFRPHQSLRPEGRESAEPRLLLFATAHFETPEATPRQPRPEETDFAIHYEFYETDMTTLNSWIVDEGLTASGPDLRNRFAEAIDEGKASLLDSVVAAGAPGEVRFQSARQVIYPSEYDPPEADRPVPAMPVAFQEWEVGLLIQFQCEWQPNGSLRIGPQDRTSRGLPTAQHVIRWDRELGEQRWLERESEVVFPLFYSMKIRQPLYLLQDEVVLLGTLRPDREAGETEQPIITVFARMEKFGETGLLGE